MLLDSSPCFCTSCWRATPNSIGLDSAICWANKLFLPCFPTVCWKKKKISTFWDNTSFWHQELTLSIIEIFLSLGRKEGNVSFNDTLTTFYLWLYGVRHMVKNHTDRERGNPLLPLVFWLAAMVLLYASSLRQDNTYHSLCYTSCGALAGTRNSPNGSTMKDWSDDPYHHERMPLPQSYISLLFLSLSQRLLYSQFLSLCVCAKAYYGFKNWDKVQRSSHSTLLTGSSTVLWSTDGNAWVVFLGNRTAAFRVSRSCENNMTWILNNEWMNEWMFNDTPAQKADRLLGVRKR